MKALPLLSCGVVHQILPQPPPHPCLKLRPWSCCLIAPDPCLFVHVSRLTMRDLFLPPRSPPISGCHRQRSAAVHTLLPGVVCLHVSTSLFTLLSAFTFTSQYFPKFRKQSEVLVKHAARCAGDFLFGAAGQSGQRIGTSRGLVCTSSIMSSSDRDHENTSGQTCGKGFVLLEGFFQRMK